MQISLFLTLFLLLISQSFALYTSDRVVAYKLPANVTMRMDDDQDSIWWSIAGKTPSYRPISFQDYSKIILLPDSIRNKNPQNYYSAPQMGNMAVLAAYDKSNLFLLFILRLPSPNLYKGSRCKDSLSWKADAVQVFLDPNTWSPFLYSSYFSADGSYSTFGTSPSTIEIDRPLYLYGTKYHYRDRSYLDRFSLDTIPPSGMDVKRFRNSLDTSIYMVKMKIPFWGNNPTAFKNKSSMYISWGYNDYVDAFKDSCMSTPTAYRWAKHFKNYDSVEAKDRPPGFIRGDSTHFDPTRSWDGWGQLYFDSTDLNPKACQYIQANDWDILHWESSCYGGGTVAIKEKALLASDRNDLPQYLKSDVLGRSVEEKKSINSSRGSQKTITFPK